MSEINIVFHMADGSEVTLSCPDVLISKYVKAQLTGSAITTVEVEILGPVLVRERIYRRIPNE